MRIARLGTDRHSTSLRARQAARVTPLLVLLAVACSDDPSSPKDGDTPGTFTARLTGAVNATLTGTATFVAQEGQGYEVEMQAQSFTNGTGLWVTAGKGRPAVGSYAVTPETPSQPLPTVMTLSCANAKAPCSTMWGAFWETNAGAGRLEITESTPRALAGSFDVDLRTDTGNVSGGGPPTHVSARFNATCRLTSGC